MDESKKILNEEEARQYYADTFMPQVHRIGRTTMSISIVLAFLPVLYFIIVKGYRLPVSNYITVFIAVSSVAVGGWLTESLTYWPVLGSAGTYIGYLSGNVSSMRFPVALNLQSAMKADINTPRGQIVTIVGIVASVYVNLILLLVFVLGGDWIISLLPPVITAAFAFVIPGLMGSMVSACWNGSDGIIKGFLKGLPYFGLAFVLCFVFGKIPALSAYGMAISVLACVLLGYVFYKRDCKRDEEEDGK